MEELNNMNKEEVRARVMEYMKDWNEHAKPVLIEVKKALAEAEAEKPVPDIKEMKKKTAAARRQKIFGYIELEASRGENYFTADKHELDDDVKKELLTAGYEIILMGAGTLKPTYLIRWK